jgi:hypothetical protein
MNDNTIEMPDGRVLTSAGVGEIEMHHGEALLWIKALEWYIAEHLRFQVPTWRMMELVGWKPEQPAEL